MRIFSFIFLLLLTAFSSFSQTTLECYTCEPVGTCNQCGLGSQLFEGLLVKRGGPYKDIALHKPIRISSFGNNVTLQDAFYGKVTLNVTQIQTYNTVQKLYNFVNNCKCGGSGGCCIIDFDSTAYLRQSTIIPGLNSKAFIKETENLYYADLSDTTSVDDGYSVIVQNDYRWKCITCSVEERICLNNANPLIVVADINNPTAAEVQTWASANLTTVQKTNGTILTYYIDGDCDNPDYTWVLNKGSELITLVDKRVKTSNTIYVDNIRGSDIEGHRNYFDQPFKTFTQALTQYNDGDWIKYWNTDETISGININPTKTTFNFDYGDGNITIAGSGNAIIGSGDFIDTSIKKALIKSNGILTINKRFIGHRNISININAKDIYATTAISFSKDNILINIDNLITTYPAPLGWWSGSNKKVHIYVKNLELNNTAISGYIPGIFNPEISGEDTDGNIITCIYDNIKFNSSFGCPFFLYSGSATGNYFKNSIAKFEANNFNQSSSFTSYSLGSPFPTRSLLMLTGTDNGSRLNNNKIYLNVNNQDSDISVQQEGMAAGALIDNCLINVNVSNSIVRKLYSFRFGPSTFNNSVEKITGNYINLSTLPIIYINGLSLTNNSVLEFNGNFKSNTNIDLLGLTIDATSKIIFKGRYELGAGKFDISGITGVGADNIYFEDCTIVTNATECIYSGTAKNVKIINARSNKPAHANVTETISPILVNSNIQ